jgi:predicted nuclease of predicted toxin-antitoxin system
VRLLVDASLSPAVAEGLRKADHDVVHVGDVGLLRASDEEILARARQDRRVLVSVDADFGGLLAGSGATGPSVVLLRSRDDLTPGQQTVLLTANLTAVTDDLVRGAVVVVDRRRVRVRNLPIQRSP